MNVATHTQTTPDASSLHTWTSLPGEWTGPACPQYIPRGQGTVMKWMPVTNFLGTLYTIDYGRGVLLMDLLDVGARNVMWAFSSAAVELR